MRLVRGEVGGVEGPEPILAALLGAHQHRAVDDDADLGLGVVVHRRGVPRRLDEVLDGHAVLGT